MYNLRYYLAQTKFSYLLLCSRYIIKNIVSNCSTYPHGQFLRFKLILQRKNIIEWIIVGVCLTFNFNFVELIFIDKPNHQIICNNLFYVHVA